MYAGARRPVHQKRRTWGATGTLVIVFLGLALLWFTWGSSRPSLGVAYRQSTGPTDNGRVLNRGLSIRQKAEAPAVLRGRSDDGGVGVATPLKPGICEEASAQELQLMRGRIKGTINCPQDGVSYNASVQIFNQRLISWPSVVVQPAEEDDVVFALNLAKQRGLAVTVKVDTGESLARVQAGANWEDVMVELEAREAKQVYVGGQCPTVGVPGVSLGGGIGWMSRSHGLISDNVEYFRVALPGGQVVLASPQENAELYWGLAGCGHANFGVVTEVGLKLLPEQERYWGGMLCFQELDEASTMQLLEVYQQGVTRELDDRISFYGLVNRQVPLAEVDADNGNKPAEDGSNMHAQVCLTAFFDGPVQEAGAAARPLLGKLAQLLKSSQGLLQNSMMEGLRFSARMGGHKELERALDNDTGELEAGMKLLMDGSVFDQGHTWRSFAHLMGGRQMQVYWRSGMLQDIPEWYPQAISRQFFTPVPMLPQLVRQDLPFRNRYFFLQLELHHVGGVVSSHPRRKQSSYPHRDALFVASLLCFSPRWDLEADTPMMQRLRFRVTDSMHDTMTRFYNSLSPAFAGAYPNYNDREQTDWEEAYYGGSLPRLKALQQSLGAEQLFRTHQRLGNASLAKL